MNSPTNVVEIRNCADSVQLSVIEKSDGGASGFASTRLDIRVQNGEFSGRAQAWFRDSDIQKFIIDCDEFERARIGTIQLDSMSPGIAQLQFLAIDGWGHLALQGQIQKYLYGKANAPLVQSLIFVFELESEMFGRLVKELAMLLAHT